MREKAGCRVTSRKIMSELRGSSCRRRGGEGDGGAVTAITGIEGALTPISNEARRPSSATGCVKRWRRAADALRRSSRRLVLHELRPVPKQGGADIAV